MKAEKDKLKKLKDMTKKDMKCLKKKKLRSQYLSNFSKPVHQEGQKLDRRHINYPKPLG